MIIRLLQPGEGTRAAALTNACQGAAQWPAADYERLAEEATSRSNNVGRFCLLAEETPGEIAGLLAASIVAEQAEVLNLAVVPEKRRRGLATALLAEVLRLLSAAGARKVWLEVRESNQAAIAFYRRHGFEPLGRRRDYYQAPREDALILGRNLDLSLG